MLLATPTAFDRPSSRPMRIMGVPGVTATKCQPGRERVVCPGYAGHLPGDATRFGGSRAFILPESCAASDRTSTAARPTCVGRPTATWLAHSSSKSSVTARSSSPRAAQERAHATRSAGGLEKSTEHLSSFHGRRRLGSREADRSIITTRSSLFALPSWLVG